MTFRGSVGLIKWKVPRLLNLLVDTRQTPLTGTRMKSVTYLRSGILRIVIPFAVSSAVQSDKSQYRAREGHECPSVDPAPST